MPRSTNSKVTRARHHKILKLAKGYFGSKHTLYRTAHEQVMRSLRYQFRDRKQRKRNFRKLWITRINAACRLNGISYSLFITGLKREKIELNRKVLAELAVSDPNAFKDLVAVAKKGVKKQLPAEFGQLEKELPAYLNPQDFGTAKNAKASKKAESKPAAEKKAAPAKATATKTVAEKKETVKKEAPAKTTAAKKATTAAKPAAGKKSAAPKATTTKASAKPAAEKKAAAPKTSSAKKATTTAKPASEKKSAAKKVVKETK